MEVPEVQTVVSTLLDEGQLSHTGCVPVKLWLDDIRDPVKFGCRGFVWAKTAEEAVAYLKSGEVTYASLDHDLTEKQMVLGGYLGIIHDDGVKSGYDVVCWLEQNPQYLPPDGINLHSANPAGRDRMRQVIEKLYGNLKQDQESEGEGDPEEV